MIVRGHMVIIRTKEPEETRQEDVPFHPSAFSLQRTTADTTHLLGVMPSLLDQRGGAPPARASMRPRLARSPVRHSVSKGGLEGDPVEGYSSILVMELTTVGVVVRLSSSKAASNPSVSALLVSAPGTRIHPGISFPRPLSPC